MQRQVLPRFCESDAARKARAGFLRVEGSRNECGGRDAPGAAAELLEALRYLGGGAASHRISLDARPYRRKILPRYHFYLGQWMPG
jgi:hypothetical protein